MSIAGLFLLATCLIGFSVADPKPVNWTVPGCPEGLRIYKDVDFTKLQGAWYVQYLTANTTDHGCDGTCWTVYYPSHNVTQLGVRFCCQQPNGVPYCNNVLGSGTLDNLCSGVTNYTTGVTSFNGHWLALDYDDYFVAYICGILPNGAPYSGVFSVTRAPIPDPSFFDFVPRVLVENGIDPSIAVRIPHNEQCNYNFRCDRPRPHTKYEWLG